MVKTLLQKLPYSVKNVYKDLNITTKFQFKPTTEDIIQLQTYFVTTFDFKDIREN